MICLHVMSLMPFLCILPVPHPIQVVAQHLLFGKSGDDLKPALQALKNRYLLFEHQLPVNWTTDDCCTDAPLLRSIFSQSLRIMLDVFHFMQRFADATYGVKHPAFFEFLARLRQAIFCCYLEDKQKVSYSLLDDALLLHIAHTSYIPHGRCSNDWPIMLAQARI